MDASGLPWDGRIHASTRTKTQDDLWKMKRNAPEEVVEKVTDELRQTMGAGTVDTPTPSQVFAIAPAIAPAAITPPPFAPVAVTPAPPASTSTTETPQAGTVTGASLFNRNPFIALMKQITVGHTNKTLTQEAITQAVQSVGLTSLPMLNVRPDLIPAVAQSLGLTL